ncbi:MAG TPA: DUF969 domain-containing protein [Rhizomicrobium sp.]
MWPLLGVAFIALGFALRLNPLLAIAGAALASGLAAHLTPVEILSAFGKAFNENRYVSVVFLVLPVIGLLERAGLQERARTLIGRVRAATAGRLLLTYLLARQVSASLGLTALGGHPQMVRPLIAPMAEAAAERSLGQMDEKTRGHIRAHSAAADNIGLFFGEDIFIAIGSILLIRAFLANSGVAVQPLELSLWAIPTAIAAFLIHGARLLLLDRRLARGARNRAEPAP